MATWLFEADFGSGWEDITAYVKLNTMQRRMDIHKELRPTTNTMTFNISGDATLIGKLMVGDADVPVQVHKDEADYFAGYLQRTTEASVSTGLDDVRITVYDPGIKLQRKVSANYSAASITVTNAVAAILTAGGITDQSLSTISTTIDGICLKAGEDTYWDAIEALLTEFGYVLYFDESGTAKTYFLYPAYPTSSKTYTTGSTGNVDDRLTVAKKKKRYGGCKVTYYRHITKTDAIVFSDTTNAGQLNKCNIDLTGYANGYPDRASGTDVVYAEYSHEDGEVLYTSSVDYDIRGTGSVTVSTFTDYGTRAALRITGTGVVTRCDIVAGTAVIKGPAVIKEALITGVSEPSEEIECRYLTADADAAVLVSGRKKYWEKSGITWGFKTTDDVTLGSIITISDSNLSVNQVCLLVGYDEDDEAKRTVWCEAIEDYALATITTTGIATSVNPPTIGGQDAQDVADLTYVFQQNTPPSANVTDLSFTSSANSDGSVDVTASWSYAQGDVAASGFLVFYKFGTSAPSAINYGSDPGIYVAAEGTTSYSHTIPAISTTYGGVGGVPKHYRFAVVAVGLRAVGMVAHADGVVEDASWIDKTFTGAITDMEITAYSGEGERRRYVRLSDNAARWGNAPDGGTETEVARMIRMDVASDAVLLDGEFVGNIDAKWSAEALIEAGTTPAYIQRANGQIRIALINATYVREAIWNGTSWGSSNVIASEGNLASPTYVETSEGELRLAYYRVSGTAGIYERIWNDDTDSWGDPVLIGSDDSASPTYIVRSNGELRIAYTIKTTRYLVERVWDGASWGDEVLITDKATAYPKYGETINKELRIAYNINGNDIVEKIYNDSTGLWGESETTIDTNAFKPSYIVLADGELRIAYEDGSLHYIYERIYADGMWSDEYLVSSTYSTDPDYIQLANGELRLCYVTSSNVYERRLERYAPIATVKTNMGLKRGLMFRYSTTDTLAYEKGIVEVNNGTSSKLVVVPNDGTLDVSSMSNGQWKFICITQDGTLSLETATGAGSVRPSDTCFTYNGGTGSFLNVGKYGYYFSATKRIIAAVHKVSTTSFYIINLGSGIEEWGQNSNGSWQIAADGTLVQWGVKSITTGGSTVTSLRCAANTYRGTATLTFPIAFTGTGTKLSLTDGYGGSFINGAMGTSSISIGAEGNSASTTIAIDWIAFGRWK